MKKQSLFLMAAALCGTLTLASCSTEADEPVVAPAAKQVSVTLSLPCGADTRTVYTDNGSGGLKTSWAENDVVTLVDYKSGKYINMDISDMASDGSTATFKGEIPGDWDLTNVSLGIDYPKWSETVWTCYMDYTKQDGSLSSLGDYDAFSLLIKYDDGKLTPDGEYERYSTFLRLPSGTSIGQSGNSIDIELYGDEEKIFSKNTPASAIAYSVAGGEDNIHVSTTASDGKLTSDVYIVFEVIAAGIDKVYLKIGENIYEIAGENIKFERGKMYTIGDLSKYKVVAPQVGMVIGSDGKYYENKAAAEAVEGVKAEAMIAYLGTEAEGAAHGLAIALEDTSSSGVAWANAGSTVSSWADDHKVTGGTWRLPSADDWKYMFQGCGGDSYKADLADGMEFSYGDFHTNLIAAGGDSADVQSTYYWSSTVYYSDFVWSYNFSVGSFWWYNGTNDFSLRAALAF